MAPLFADQMVEGLAVLKAAGIEPVAATAVPPGYVPTVLRLPDTLFRMAASRMLKIDPEARSSMWEDFIRRRPTEVDYLQGAIMRLAERHGVAAPLSKRIVALVKRAEAAGAGSPGLTPGQKFVSYKKSLGCHPGYCRYRWARWALLIGRVQAGLRWQANERPA